MCAPALLPLLGAVDGLGGVQHQVLQLKGLHQICVPHDAWMDIEGGENNNNSSGTERRPPLVKVDTLYHQV